MSKEEDQKPLPQQPESQELYGDSEIVVEFNKIQDRDFAQEVQEIAESFPQEVQDSYEFKENLRRNVQNIIDLQEMHGELQTKSQSQLESEKLAIADTQENITSLEKERVAMDASDASMQAKEDLDFRIELLKQDINSIEGNSDKAPDLESAQNAFKETLQLTQQTFEVMGKMPPQKYIYRLEDMTQEQRQEAFSELNKLQSQKSQQQQKSPEEIFAEKYKKFEEVISDLDDDLQEVLFDKIAELNEVEQKQNSQEKFSTSPDFYAQLTDSLTEFAQAPINQREDLKEEILQTVNELIEYAQSQGVQQEAKVEVQDSPPSLPDQQPTAQEAEPAVSDNLTPSEQAKSAKRMAAIEAMEKGEQKTEQEQKPELEFQQLAKLEAVKQELQEQAAKAPADRRASQTINQNKGQGQGAGSQQSR